MTIMTVDFWTTLRTEFTPNTSCSARGIRLLAARLTAGHHCRPSPHTAAADRPAPTAAPGEPLMPADGRPFAAKKYNNTYDCTYVSIEGVSINTAILAHGARGPQFLTEPQFLTPVPKDLWIRNIYNEFQNVKSCCYTRDLRACK